MKRIRIFALGLGALIASAGALAQQPAPRPDSMEHRLERIEQALARLEKNCREMMKGGGMMGGGMMGRSRPNEQWRAPDSRK